MLTFYQMRDRIDQVRDAVKNYPNVDFLPIRIEDAFDQFWWESTIGGPLSSNIHVGLSSEGKETFHLE
jgi:cytoplasmic tRNA 2-thiolation protein 2